MDDHKLHTTTDDNVLDVYACKDADTSHVSSTGTDLVVGRRGFTSHDELPDQRAAVSQTSASSGQSISIMDPVTGLRRTQVSTPIEKALKFVQETEPSFRVKKLQQSAPVSDELDDDGNNILTNFKTRAQEIKRNT